MPWKASSVVEERTRFVLEYERGLCSMAELCRSYGISRETGYVWWRRYGGEGLEGLRDRSRAPHEPGNRTPEQIEAMVLELRREHMRWGPRKLKWVLEQAEPGMQWPAASTIGALLAREGLAMARKKRHRVPPYTQPFAAASQSNRVWCADFKGWFRTGDGTRIDPLTITDAYSRYLLRSQAVEKTDTERVRAIFEAAFREHGLPEAIRTDNVAPFASSAIAGLSRLAVWWIKLGIVPERIQAGHPEQNGRHERMHRTLKQELRPVEDWRAQQRELDRFRQEYNQVRPHEALAMETPASVYEPSPRLYPAREPEVEYPDAMRVLRVKSQGCFRWKKHDVFLSEVLWGEPIGLLPVNERFFNLYFAHLHLAQFDSKTCTLCPLPHGRRHKDKNKNLPDKEKLSGMGPV